ncbi:hypothetical protein TRVL_08815 [Trypanosoma vivax]|nr:hypothetical protein TRVL_08815 [Trypanosoma vivax]
MYVHERHACTWLRAGAHRVLFPTDYNLWHARLFCLWLSGIPLPLALCATRPRLVPEAAARLPPRCPLKHCVGMCFCLSFPMQSPTRLCPSTFTGCRCGAALTELNSFEAVPPPRLVPLDYLMRAFFFPRVCVWRPVRAW